MSQVRSSYQVKGLENVLRELRKVEPDTVRTLRKNARLIASPAVKSAKEEFRWQASVSSTYSPDKPGGRRANKAELQPLAGMSRGRLIKGREETRWNPSKIIGGIKFKMGAGSKRRRGYKNYSLFSIIQANAAGAIYDMAGKKRSNPAKTFEESLDGVDKPHHNDGKTGPSRYMYPGVEGQLPEMQRQMLGLIRDLERRINRRIVKG